MITNLNCEVDSNAETAFISFDFQGSNCCNIYVTKQGDRKLLKILNENSVELCLNEEEELWVPMPEIPAH